MMDQVKVTAREVTKNVLNEQESPDSSDEEDEDFIGPPIPTDLGMIL